MNNYTIITDSCCDLPLKYIQEKNIPFIRLSCIFKGKEYLDDFGQSLSFKEFYDGMRDGAVPTTSQPSTDAIYSVLKEIVEKGDNVLYICVSSGLSGTYNGANVAKDMLLEEFPKSRIEIIDCLTASMAEGLLVMRAVEMKETGSSLDEIITFMNQNIQHLNTYMTVDDLIHLKRGGRISSAAAVLGIMLHIKPVLAINSEGKVLTVLKAKGRKNSLGVMADLVSTKIENPENQVIAISHGDSLKEAEILKSQILSKVTVKDIIINDIGPVVGRFGGPGALSVCFMGKKRHSIPLP